MKKAKIIISLILSVLLCFCVGCIEMPEDPEAFVPVKFGYFSYNGKSLTAYAHKEITAQQAKNIVQNKQKAVVQSVKEKGETRNDLVLLSINPADVSKTPAPSKVLVDETLDKYASLNVTTKYYVSGDVNQQSKTDFLQGTDLKSILEANQFIPFSQLVAKGVLIFDELIDYMEEQNEIFKNSEISKIAPFKTIFSYHTDYSGNIVIQTRDFAEIPSSVGGGIGCSYRQDTELVYDKECKLTKWQTSLGVYSATPTGTLMQGYILEVELDWVEKE